MTVAEQAPDTTATEAVHTRALIIGSGFSGLGMGIALQQQGVDFVILEKADDIGGTWRDNTYPGCACDIPSHMYSFSFEPKPDWTHMWSFQPEIQEYLQGVTDKYGLRRYIRFNSHVDRAHWDDDEMRWHAFTKDGREFVAQFLISGAGGLHIPLIPDFYTDFLMVNPNAPNLVGFRGTLSATGSATAAIQIPAAVSGAFTLHHAFIVYTGGSIHMASNASTLWVK